MDKTYRIAILVEATEQKEYASPELTSRVQTVLTTMTTFDNDDVNAVLRAAINKTRELDDIQRKD